MGNARVYRRGHAKVDKGRGPGHVSGYLGEML